MLNVFTTIFVVNIHNNTMFRTHGHFHLTQVHIQPTFTERIQSRAYNMDDVVGAVGGYVGLFMGYSIVQFPDAIMFIIAYIQKRKGKIVLPK